MTAKSRLSKALLAVAILVATLAVVACGGSSESAAAASMGGPIEVEVSQLFITVTNRSGGAITDLKVEIIPIGRATIFTASHYRLESESKRDFSMADLRGSDGTPFNLRIHKPRSIRVTAKGMSDNYDIEVPWG